MRSHAGAGRVHTMQVGALTWWGKAKNMPMAAKSISTHTSQLSRASESSGVQPKRVARNVTTRPCAWHGRESEHVK